MFRRRPRPTPTVTANIPNLNPVSEEENSEPELADSRGSVQDKNLLGNQEAEEARLGSTQFAPAALTDKTTPAVNETGEKAAEKNPSSTISLRPPRRQRREYPQRRGRARKISLTRRLLKMWPVFLLLVVLLSAGGIYLYWWYQHSPVKAQKTEILKVSGEFGAQPVVTVAEELPITLPKTSKLITGTGEKIRPDSDVYLKISVFSGKDGQSITPYGIPRLLYGKNTVELLGPDLYQAINGHEVGTRLLIKRPVNDGTSPHMEIDIVDIMPTHITSTDIPQLPVPYQEENGLPQVGKASAPLTPTLNQIVTGKGEQVLAGQKVIAQFGVWELEEGKMRDYTWNKQGPQVIDLQTTYQALKAELIDARVGSRLLLLLPASEAKGDKGLAVVVDILGVVDNKQLQ